MLISSWTSSMTQLVCFTFSPLDQVCGVSCMVVLAEIYELDCPKKKKKENRHSNKHVPKNITNNKQFIMFLKQLLK